MSLGNVSGIVIAAVMRRCRKQGALLSKVDMNAYDSEPDIANEVQFVWHLDL